MNMYIRHKNLKLNNKKKCIFQKLYIVIKNYSCVSNKHSLRLDHEYV